MNDSDREMYNSQSSQAVFADFNLEGELDLVLPVCFDPSCSDSSLLQHTVKEVWEKGAKLEWKVMSLDLGGLRFAATSVPRQKFQIKMQ